MHNAVHVKVKVMEVFDEIASSYAYSRIRPWPQVVELIRKYDRKGWICDVGCGPGQYSIAISLMGNNNVLAMDISMSMLVIVRKRAIRKGVYQLVDVVQADMEYMPLRNDCVSMVLHIATIHHLPSLECRANALREVYRVLKSNGVLIATVWSLVQLRFLKHFLKNILLRLIGRKKSIGDVIVPWRHKGRVLYRYYHLFLSRELRKLIVTAGFKILEYGGLKIRTKIMPDNYYVVGVKE